MLIYFELSTLNEVQRPGSFFFFCILTVISRIMPPPKDAYIPIPRTCVYVAIHYRKDFADMIKFRDLEEGSKWVQSNNTCPLKWRTYPGCGQKKRAA